MLELYNPIHQNERLEEIIIAGYSTDECSVTVIVIEYKSQKPGSQFTSTCSENLFLTLYTLIVKIRTFKTLI